MNKIIFISAVLFSWITNVDSNGQDLYPKKGNNNKWGYIDKVGKVVVPFKYDQTWDFSEELAMVRLNFKWGYIDKTGKVVIPFKYDYGDILFSGGLAPVAFNGQYGYIDKSGAEVVPIVYPSWQEAYKQKILNRLFSNYAQNYADAKVAEENFIADAHRVLNIYLSLSQYDANKQTFIVTDDFLKKNMPIYVPASRAKNFSDSWEQIEFSIQYGIENDQIAIKEINFKLPNGETYNTM